MGGPSGVDPRAEASTGILPALAACGLFALVNGSPGGRYPVVRVVLFDPLFAFAAVPTIAALRGPPAGAESPHRRSYLPHRAIGAPGGLVVFRPYPRPTLADVYAILVSAPPFTTALSVPVPGELVGRRRWTTVLPGFVGILVIPRPQSGLFDAAALPALVGALVHASNVILLRRVRGIDSPEVSGIRGNGLAVPATAPARPSVRRAPSAADLARHAFPGSVAGGGFLLLVLAHARATVAVLAPFQYSRMPFGIAIGALLFGDSPEPEVLAGAAVVVTSGLHVFHREALRRRGTEPR